MSIISDKIEIKRICSQDLPMDLVLLADESAEAVETYLSRSMAYAAILDGAIIGEYLLLPTRPFTVEIINVAVQPEYQRQGIGEKMVRHAIETARSMKYRIVEISTGNCGIGQIALYQRCGFTIHSVDHDFIIDNYPEPIFENGIQCRDMVRLRMKI